MPVFYQHIINEHTKLGIWKIEEPESFFLKHVPIHRAVTHPAKRLQHLAGRFLLQYLFADFPYKLIQIADTKKPYLENEAYHFSISHCDNYAAAIVSKSNRVGIDIEIAKPMIMKIIPKFLSAKEIYNLKNEDDILLTTKLWSAKEAVYKWWGYGGVDFKKDIQLSQFDDNDNELTCEWKKQKTQTLHIQIKNWDHLVLAFVIS